MGFAFEDAAGPSDGGSPYPDTSTAREAKDTQSAIWESIKRRPKAHRDIVSLYLSICRSPYVHISLHLYICS